MTDCWQVWRMVMWNMWYLLMRTQQQEQMDVIIHFWDNEKNKVCSRYFDSNFLGHTSAQDLKSLQSLLTTLNPKGLIWLSMDGPSTSWKLLDRLSEDQVNSDPELINVSSCGLHIIHGAIKTGAIATGWHIDNHYNLCGICCLMHQQRRKTIWRCQPLKSSHYNSVLPDG